jgi:preprotein translocase subunit SecY
MFSESKVLQTSQLTFFNTVNVMHRTAETSRKDVILQFISIWILPIFAAFFAVVVVYFLQRPRISIKVQKNEKHNIHLELNSFIYWLKTNLFAYLEEV